MIAEDTAVSREDVEEFWNRVYDVLVVEAKVPHDARSRSDFVSHQPVVEYGYLGGKLGACAKLYCNGHLYVTSYQPTQTQEQLDYIERTNAALKPLSDEYFIEKRFPQPHS